MELITTIIDDIKPCSNDGCEIVNALLEKNNLETALDLELEIEKLETEIVKYRTSIINSLKASKEIEFKISKVKKDLFNMLLKEY